MAQAIVEIFTTDDGLVLVSVTPPWGAPAVLEMDPDDARGFSNNLGAAIHDIATTGDDMPDFAAWTAEPPDAEEPVADPRQVAPAPVAEPGAWLPASVQRSIALESIADDTADRKAKKDRADHAEAERDASAAAWLAAAAARGEPVAPIDAATGNIGTPLTEILERARGDLVRDYAPTPKGDETFYGEPKVQAAKRSAWTSSSRSLGHDSATPGEYERDSLADHQVRRARELHDWLTGYRVKHDYETIHAEAMAKSDAAHGRVTRSAAQRDYDEYGEITRTVPMIFQR